MFHNAPVAQRDRAGLTYVSYAGTWDLDDEVVTHHVSFALFPNAVGADFVRHLTWEDDTLILTTAPEISTSGKSIVNRLFWQRAARHREMEGWGT